MLVLSNLARAALLALGSLICICLPLHITDIVTRKPSAAAGGPEIVAHWANLLKARLPTTQGEVYEAIFGPH